jgi:hypothetical protein
MRKRNGKSPADIFNARQEKKEQLFYKLKDQQAKVVARLYKLYKSRGDREALDHARAEGQRRYNKLAERLERKLNPKSSRKLPAGTVIKAVPMTISATGKVKRAKRR